MLEVRFNTLEGRFNMLEGRFDMLEVVAQKWLFIPTAHDEIATLKQYVTVVILNRNCFLNPKI